MIGFWIGIAWVLIISVGSSAPYGDHILRNVKTTTPASVQELAANEVIGRIVPELAHLFRAVVIDDGTLQRNSFRLVSSTIAHEHRITITASSGVAATKGFYHYLKYYCNCQVAWEGVQLNLPSPLPAVNVTVEAPSSIIYYQNVCTWSYSFSWWSWEQWRTHIDWMALQGITLSLAPFQEDIWTELYREYNLTQDDIDEHLSGPGFFAWQRMGNIRGWGGPLTDNFQEFSSGLQLKIVSEMRRLGMTLALPAFAGHLPVKFKSLFPNANFSTVMVWNHFPPQYASPLFLDPTDPLFLDIGSKFLTRMVDRYGTDHIYFSDPFNEVNPASSGSEYLANVASAIYRSMILVDPAAVWLLQGWMFVKNPFWGDDTIRSFLTAVPLGRMLILDLQSEQYPQYVRTKSYHGQPFIWCMLSNFGGTLGFLGSVDNVFERIRKVRTDGNYTMLGTGIAPEGINQNYALYEFALEMGWEAELNDVDNWFRTFAKVRYGSENQQLADVWDIIRRTVYSFSGLELMRGKYTFNRRPSLNLNPWVWYNVTTFNRALDLLLTANITSTNTLYAHDVVDVTRQFLQNTADQLYLTIIDDYDQRKSSARHASLFLDLLDDLEQLLRTSDNFLLGRWLEASKALAQTKKEQQMYEYNARMQITLWGPQGQIVDYANKQWSGMVEDFFRPRWALFFTEMDAAWRANRTLNSAIVRERIFRTVELPFATDRKRYPVNAFGDALPIARKIYRKWATVTGEGNLRELPMQFRKHQRRRHRHNHPQRRRGTRKSRH